MRCVQHAEVNDNPGGDKCRVTNGSDPADVTEALHAFQRLPPHPNHHHHHPPRLLHCHSPGVTLITGKSSPHLSTDLLTFISIFGCRCFILTIFVPLAQDYE